MAPAAFRRVHWICFVLVVVVFLGLLTYACSGPRGADQFWYISDMETLNAGKAPLTNTLYPGTYLRDKIPVDKTYFIHNVPSVHVGAWLGQWLSPYGAWITLNAIYSLVAAGALALAARRLVSPAMGVIVFAGYLLMPLTFWQSANVLQEALFGMIVALQIALYVSAGGAFWRWAALLVVSAAAVLFHPLFLPVAALMPLVMLWDNRAALRARHVLLAATALAVAGGLQCGKSVWMPSTFQPGLREIILGTAPNRGNMVWHFSVDHPPITAGMIFAKALIALKQQFIIGQRMAFLVPVNALLFGSLFLLRQRGNRPARRVLLATGVFVALFVGLVVLHQNQFRYSIFILPGVLLCCALVAGRWMESSRARRWVCGVVLVGLAGFVSVNVAAARHLRREGIKSRAAIAELRETVSHIPADEHILLETPGSGADLPLARALYPRPCMFVRVDRLTSEQIRELIETFKPTVLFARRGGKLPDLLGVSPGPEKMPSMFDRGHIYMLLPAETMFPPASGAPRAR
ncbi:MAG: hypothetical protein HN909_07555 [Phycisphaerales bacterium]|nr:hypothetical protein [Phycisphaerales bacterium]